MKRILVLVVCAVVGLGSLACEASPAAPLLPPPFVDTLTQPPAMENASTLPNTVEATLTAAVGELQLAPDKAASRVFV